MRPTNTHSWRGDFLLAVVTMVVVVMAVSMAEVVAAPSYSPCVRPMDVKCAPDTRASDKIIGGQVAEPGSTPWLVSLQDTQFTDPAPFCGGTLLSHTWVLTSATCVYSYQYNVDNIEVVLGEYDMTEVEGYEKSRRVTDIYVHPDYDYYTRHADVALLKLTYYVPYTDRINVLRLPAIRRDAEKDDNDDDDDDDNDEKGDHSGEDMCWNGCSDTYLFTIAGWGRLGETGDLSPVVRVAYIPLVNREECREIYPEFTHTMICAGNLTHGGLDSCQGDMGGALSTSNGYIKGVASWGVSCGLPGYPGVYTDVEQVVDWICSVTNKSSPPANHLIACRYG